MNTNFVLFIAKQRVGYYVFFQSSAALQLKNQLSSERRIVQASYFRDGEPQEKAYWCAKFNV